MNFPGCTCPRSGLYWCDVCTALAVKAGIAVPTLTSPRRSITPPESMDPDSPEGVLQDRLRQLALDTGHLYYHTYASKRSDPGWLDTAILHPGGGPLHLWELKTDTEGPKPAQQRWLDALALTTRVDVQVYRPRDWGTMRDILIRRAA